MLLFVKSLTGLDLLGLISCFSEQILNSFALFDVFKLPEESKLLALSYLSYY